MKNTDIEEVKQNKKEDRHNPFLFILEGIYRKVGFITIIVLIGLCIFCGFRLGKMIYGNSITGKKTQITDTMLYQQLERENELSTVRYFYTNMGKYENSIQVGNTNIPFTKKSFIIAYDGIIKAGIDMDKVGIHVNGKVITIFVPEAEILSHEIDEDSIQVYDEKNSIFNGLSTEDVMNFQKEQKKEMEQRAVSNGILKEAKENAQRSLQFLYGAFLENDQYEEGYILKFKDIENE